MNIKSLPLAVIALLLQSVGLKAQIKDPVVPNVHSVTQTIMGTVIDKSSRLPISGVTIRLSASTAVQVTNTDQTGFFRLSAVPLGRQSLQASGVGYQPLTVSELLIISGKELVLNLEMEPKSNNLNEVVVNVNPGKRPLNQMALSSGRSFSPEETNRYAGAFFDPARMAQSFSLCLMCLTIQPYSHRRIVRLLMRGRGETMELNCRWRNL